MVFTPPRCGTYALNSSTSPVAGASDGVNATLGVKATISVKATRVAGASVGVNNATLKQVPAIMSAAFLLAPWELERPFNIVEILMLLFPRIRI